MDTFPDRSSLTSLQKFGRPNEATPSKWTSEYRDYTAPLNGAHTQPVSEQTSAPDVSSAPFVAPNGDSEPMDTNPPTGNVDAVDKTETKRAKHEGETPEERAERKRRKKEKKEKKERKKASKPAKASASEDSE